MEKTVQGLIGTLFTVAGGALTGWLGQSFGRPISTLVTIIGAVSGLSLVLAGFRNYAILGASESRWDTQEYRTYAALRRRLLRESTAARLYSRWVRIALRGVARFFGDYGIRRRTRAHEFFGLTWREPLWTAPAFDGCLLLALIYPITTIFLFWIVSGHVGPAEEALRLNQGLPLWGRCLAGFMIVAVGVGFRLIGTRTRFKASRAFLVVAGVVIIVGASAEAVVGVGAGAGAIVGAGVVAGVVAGAGVGAFAGMSSVAGVGAVAIVVMALVTVVIASAGMAMGAGIVAGAGAGAVAIVIMFTGEIAVVGVMAVVIETRHDRAVAAGGRAFS